MIKIGVFRQKNLTTRDFLMVGFQLEKKIMPFFLKKMFLEGLCTWPIRLRAN
jgi:hypothetical protein